MLRKGSYVVLIFSFFILLSAASSAVSVGNSICTSHHTGSQPSGGYTYADPTLSFSGPEFVAPNSTFTLKFLVSSPGRYEVINATASVSVSGEGELVSGEQTSKTVPSISNVGGTSAVNWTLKAKNTEGLIQTTVNLTFTSHYQHSSSSNNDYFHSISSSYGITVKTASLQLSESQLVFLSGEPTSMGFGIFAHSQTGNITLTLSPNLNGLVEITPQRVASLAAGENTTVSVSYLGNQSIVDNGRINIVWANAEGILDSAFVTVKIAEPQSEVSQSSFSVLKWTGRITGSASLVLMFASAGLGVIKIGKERRQRLHCAISWFLLIFSSYHGFVLLIGPYSSLMFAPTIIMGYASTVAMGAVSVNGLIEKWMTNLTNHKTWLWTHRIFLIIGIALAVTHGILLGTDFASIRELAGT